MTRLSVNVDHVATLRQARRASCPDPLAAAAVAEAAGASGITVHLRGDRRHMQDRDLRMLRDVVSTRLNVEMAATDEMMIIASSLKPDQVTLVPEEPGEVTTTGGLDVSANQTAISAAVRRLQDAGIPASLFIDADPDQISLAGPTGATAIEINTGPYADAPAARRAGEIVKIQHADRVVPGGPDGVRMIQGLPQQLPVEWNHQHVAVRRVIRRLAQDAAGVLAVSPCPRLAPLRRAQQLVTVQREAVENPGGQPPRILLDREQPELLAAFQMTPGHGRAVPNKERLAVGVQHELLGVTTVTLVERSLDSSRLQVDLDHAAYP